MAEAEDSPHRPRQPKPATTPESADAHVDPTEVKVDEGMLRDLESRPQSSNREPALKTSRCSESLRSMNATMPKSVCLSPARAMRLLAAPGDQVRAGQLLVELQSPELGKLRAEYVSAQARLTLAEGALKRKRDLAAEKIAPQREVQEAETEFTQAQAALRSASAALTALGVPPSASGDTESQQRCDVWPAFPGGRHGARTQHRSGTNARPGDAGFRIANLDDAVAHGPRLRAGRRSRCKGCERAADFLGAARTSSSGELSP